MTSPLEASGLGRSTSTFALAISTIAGTVNERPFNSACIGVQEIMSSGIPAHVAYHSSNLICAQPNSIRRLFKVNASSDFSVHFLMNVRRSHKQMIIEQSELTPFHFQR